MSNILEMMYITLQKWINVLNVYELHWEWEARFYTHTNGK